MYHMFDYLSLIAYAIIIGSLTLAVYSISCGWDEIQEGGRLGGSFSIALGLFILMMVVYYFPELVAIMYN